MTDDDLAALAAELIAAYGFAQASGEGLARVILESEWLREHDARVRREGYAETLRADRAEDALRDREQQLARLLSMADAWEETWGDNGIKASVAAAAVRREIRGLRTP